MGIVLFPYFFPKYNRWKEAHLFSAFEHCSCWKSSIPSAEENQKRVTSKAKK
jgi:hypothetical protein